MKQLLYSEIDDLIEEIKSGKKDLFEVILQYEKRIKEFENIEGKYEDEIDSLKDNINDLEDTIYNLKLKLRK
jgi:predicted RNase H-like nuclease (RuvC/YqgF family)